MFGCKRDDAGRSNEPQPRDVPGTPAETTDVEQATVCSGLNPESDIQNSRKAVGGEQCNVPA